MKNIYILFFFIFFYTNLNAQISVNSDEKKNEETEIFKHKVKLLDDFMDRFNYRRNFEGEKIKKDSSFKYDRVFMIKTLFEYNYYMKDSILAQEFIQSVLKNTIELDFYADNWFSIVNATILYNKIPYKINLKMQIESEKADKRAKWVIKDVEAPFLAQDKENTGLFIHPVANETNFISLSEAFNNAENIFEYTDSSFVTNDLSIFLFLIKTNQITFSNVNEISYIFNIKNWLFEVKSFNRMEHNSGWLICQLQKTGNEIEAKEKIITEDEQADKINSQKVDIGNENKNSGKTKIDKKKKN